jgi:hypothetical protein
VKSFIVLFFTKHYGLIKLRGSKMEEMQHASGDRDVCRVQSEDVKRSNNMPDIDMERRVILNGL